MGISLGMLALVSQLFDQMYYLSDTAVAIADTDQNIRCSLRAIAGDMKNCGYGIPVGGIPMPSGAGSSAVLRPGPLPVSGTVPFLAGLPGITPGPGLGPTIPGTQSTSTSFGAAPLASDVLTMVQVDLSSAINLAPITSITPTSSPAGVQIALDPTNFPLGAGASIINVNDYIMLTNVNGTAVGAVTAVDTVANTITFSSGDPLNMNQPGAAAGSIPALRNADLTYPPTAASKLRFITYYLNANLNASTPPQPTLMRQVNNSPATPVASYITAFNLTYDLLNGLTNQQIVASPSLIRKVNIMVSGRSVRPLRKTGQTFVNTMTTSLNPHNLTYHNSY